MSGKAFIDRGWRSLRCLLFGVMVMPGHAVWGRSIVIENSHVRYEAAESGKNLHFLDKATGIDYLDTSRASYCAYIKKGGKEYTVSAVGLDRDLLRYAFGGSGVTAVVRIDRSDDVLRFEVLQVTGGVESFTFMNIPLVLNGMPDEPFAACVLALNPFTHVRQLPALQTDLWASCYDRFGLRGAKIALLAVPMKEMLPQIRAVMSKDKDLPGSTAGGAWAQDNKEGYGSYLMNFGSLTAQTVDKWIEMCRNLGFNQIDNHGGGFFNFGELKIDRKRFPGGWADFRKINQQLNDSGISSIFHTYSFFIDKTSGFVTPVASPDLGYFSAFTLARPLGRNDSVITVNESTANVSTITGFFVRNSVSLRIGGEIIEFSGVTTVPPYQFTGCKRGVFGTRIADHAANERLFHLKELYGRFVPDPDSKLFTDIARRTAEIIDEAGFNGLYLDAIDGSDILGGADDFWYYGSKFIFEIARHLKRPVGMEMASMSHFWWHYRSRWQAWDMPFRGYKRFIDIHLAAIKSPNVFLTKTIRSNDFEHGVWPGDTSYINKYAPLENGSLLLPLNLGWWGNQVADPPQVETTYPDDIEYLCGKLIGNNAGVAMLGGFDKGTLTSIPLYQKLDSIVRLYEGLRDRHYFNDSVRALLRQPGKEFRLFREPDGGWNFKPVVYQKHKVDGLQDQSSQWEADNEFDEQPLKLRIEALMSVRKYDDPGSRVLADLSNPAEFSNVGAAAGVSGGISNGEFYATSDGSSPVRGSWICMEKKFEPALDLGNDEGLGVWIKGDSCGELLNIRLESPAYLSHGARGDHFVKIDFKGWKYFGLLEIESSAFSDYSWPRADYFVYNSYRHSVSFKNIDKIQLWYNNLPAGKRVSCLVRPVKALAMVAATIRNPSVQVGQRKIVFPVTMRSGMYLELHSPTDCALYGPKGEFIQEVPVGGELPSLKTGDNTISFFCDKPGEGVDVRAQVTVINEGTALPRQSPSPGETSSYKWWNPAGNNFPVIEGQGWRGDSAHPYDRFPASAEPTLREVVWSKSQEAAGLVIRFRSDAANIRVRYHVKGRLAFEHMPATGVSGLDLYAVDKTGKWKWTSRTYTFGDTITYDFPSPSDGRGPEAGDKGDREYFLYLPLYNKVEWLEIGVPEQASFQPLKVRADKPLVVYGTSIAQGGCASRPGMAWTAILGRKLQEPVINLGFSSNGLLEPPVIDLMGELDAKLFILDCLPNMSALPTDTIRGRIIRAVIALQQKRPGTPILMAEDADANIGLMDTALDHSFKRLNEIGRSAFAALKKMGVTGIYFLPATAIGLDAESTVDGLHPSDLGMEKYADAYARIIRKIFAGRRAQ